MVDVEAEEPDGVVDVEHRLWTEIVLQLAVEQKEQDVQHRKEIPPKRVGLVHLYESQLKQKNPIFVISYKSSYASHLPCSL